MTTKPSFTCSTRLSIETVYHGPTYHRGSRITARCNDTGRAMAYRRMTSSCNGQMNDTGRAMADSVTLPYDHSLSAEGNHEAAAAALAEKLGWSGWDGRWIGGSTPRGYVFAHHPA